MNTKNPFIFLPGPKSIAFEVHLDDSDDSKSNRASSIRLPKRLQRLEEHPNSLSPITAEEILERQKQAEKRRKSAIEERVLKSKYFLDKVLVASKDGSKQANGKGGNAKKSNKKNKTTNKTGK